MGELKELKVGHTADYLGRLPLSGQFERSYWQKAVVVRISDCRRYVKLRAMQSFGRRYKEFWCRMTDLPLKAFYAPNARARSHR